VKTKNVVRIRDRNRVQPRGKNPGYAYVVESRGIAAWACWKIRRILWPVY